MARESLVDSNMALAFRYLNGHNFCTGASFLGPLALSQDVLSFVADQEKARILKNNKKKDVGRDSW